MLAFHQNASRFRVMNLPNEALLPFFAMLAFCQNASRISVMTLPLSSFLSYTPSLCPLSHAG
jgi:hypothetical protein